MISLNIYLDKVALRSRQVSRYSEVLCLAKERMCRKKSYGLGEEEESQESLQCQSETHGLKVG